MSNKQLKEQAQNNQSNNIDFLLDRKVTSDDVTYRVKKVGQSCNDSVFMPAEDIPIEKRLQFEQQDSQQERRRVYKAGQLKILINTKHKVNNHFINGDLVTQIISKSRDGSFLVMWNNNQEETSNVTLQYLKHFHFGLLFDFQQRQERKKQK